MPCIGNTGSTSFPSSASAAVPKGKEDWLFRKELCGGNRKDAELLAQTYKESSWQGWQVPGAQVPEPHKNPTGDKIVLGKGEFQQILSWGWKSKSYWPKKIAFKCFPRHLMYSSSSICNVLSILPLLLLSSPLFQWCFFLLSPLLFSYHEVKWRGKKENICYCHVLLGDGPLAPSLEGSQVEPQQHDQQVISAVYKPDLTALSVTTVRLFSSGQ